MELDHLFICTSIGGPEVDKLLKLGLTEGQSNIHPGQGTSNRRIFFHNAFLEFLWVHDEQEARSELVKPLRLWERWRYQQTGASPFGIGLRPTQPMAEQVSLPFKTWVYSPSYLPHPLHIDVAENSYYAAGPLLFYSSFGRRPDAFAIGRSQPLEHAMGVKEITGLSITLNEERPLSTALEAVERAGLAEFIFGETPLAKVTFDQQKQGRAHDFRPELPLVLSW